MKLNRSIYSLALAAGVAVATLGLAGAAQAQQDVYWSVGVSSPGVRVGVASAPPVMVVQQPVYPMYQQQPRVVMVPPQPVVYMQPEPVYRTPPQYVRAGWTYPGWERGWRHGHGRYEHDRFDGERSGYGHQDHRRD